MSAGSEYVSPAEDWYRGQYRQQQERFQERQDELQARDLVDVVSYSLSNERHRTILPHQQHYAHFYPQVPPPSQNRYSLSSFDSHERYAPRPIQQHQHQQHTQLAPIHPYVPPPIIRAEPSPYSSQRIFLDDAAFSPSQYSPGSSAANTPFLYHPSSHSTSQSFYHQQITHNEGIHPIESREYCEEETRDCDESGLGQHRRTYEATRHPLFGYTQEPTVEQGYFPLVDSERYDTIVDDSQYSPSPPLPDYTPIPFAYPAPKHISPISLRAHRHIYEEPSIDYQPASPSQSPSPGPSTQHDVESSFHVARVQDYPSPQDEDRFKTAPASPPLSPLTDLTESDVDANGEDVDEGEGETRSASPTTAVSMLSGEHAEGEDADGEGEELDVETGVDTTDPPFRTDPDEAMAEELIGTTKSISPLYPPEPQPRRPRAARSIVPSSEVGHNVAPFISKLAWILRNPAEYGGTIFWNQAGTRFSFSPSSPHLINHILPTYLSHQSASAFARQLNVYGFTRLSKEATILHLQEADAPGPPRDAAFLSYISFEHKKLGFLRTSNDLRLAELRPKPSVARKIKADARNLLLLGATAEKEACQVKTTKARKIRDR